MACRELQDSTKARRIEVNELRSSLEKKVDLLREDKAKAEASLEELAEYSEARIRELMRLCNDLRRQLIARIIEQVDAVQAEQRMLAMRERLEEKDRKVVDLQRALHERGKALRRLTTGAAVPDSGEDGGVDTSLVASTVDEDGDDGIIEVLQERIRDLEGSYSALSSKYAGLLQRLQR